LDIERRRQSCPPDDAALHQRVEASGQKRGTDAVQPRGEIAKPRRPEQEFADNEQRPALSDDLRGSRQRTELRVSRPTHPDDMAEARAAVNRGLRHPLCTLHFISIISATSIVP